MLNAQRKTALRESRIYILISFCTLISFWISFSLSLSLSILMSLTLSQTFYLSHPPSRCLNLCLCLSLSLCLCLCLVVNPSLSLSLSLYADHNSALCFAPFAHSTTSIPEYPPFFARSKAVFPSCTAKRHQDTITKRTPPLRTRYQDIHTKQTPHARRCAVCVCVCVCVCVYYIDRAAHAAVVYM